MKTMKYFTFSANATCESTYQPVDTSTNERDRGFCGIITLVSHRDLRGRYMRLHARHACLLHTHFPRPKVGEEWCQPRLPCCERQQLRKRKRDVRIIGAWNEE